MIQITAWHSTSAEFDLFAPFSHFGTRAQAEMRRTKGGKLIQVELTLRQVKKLKDTGDWSLRKLKRYRSEGFTGVTYLNRFEGIPLEAFDRARAAYGDIDALSDRAFEKALPEAGQSWIIFDPADVRILNVIPAQQIG